MPNWCFSGITFYSKNEEQIRSMHKVFEEIYNAKPTEENKFGNGWMGDYANTLLPEHGADKVDCRGSVTYIDDDVQVGFGNTLAFFKIETETAWGAKIGMWQKIVEEHYPEVEIAYVGEECGNGYFVKWDKNGLFYNEEYYLDGCLPSKTEGEYIYLSDWFDGCGTARGIAEIQEDIDEASSLQYTHSDNECDLEANILAALSEIGDDELYFNIAKYEEVAPAEFDFLI